MPAGSQQALVSAIASEVEKVLQQKGFAPEIQKLQAQIDDLKKKANNSLLQKLQPEISAVSAINSKLASMESTITSLPAGASITLTYSTAPTWEWVPE